MADEPVPVQDDIREKQMVRLLGLMEVKGRMGHDAEDSIGRKFELKSTTKTNFGTGRDVSLDTIGRWRKLYWVFAKGESRARGFEITEMWVCTPEMMCAEFDRLSARFELDVTIRDKTITHMTDILCKAHLTRLNYLINRGMTYNNPHIGLNYVRENGVKLDLNDPAESLKMALGDQAGSGQ